MFVNLLKEFMNGFIGHKSAQVSTMQMVILSVIVLVIMVFLIRYFMVEKGGQLTDQGSGLLTNALGKN